jgi:hypothetical protein
MRKKSGDRGEPLGIPDNNEKSIEEKPGRHSEVELSKRNDEMKLKIHVGRHLSLRYE